MRKRWRKGRAKGGQRAGKGRAVQRDLLQKLKRKPGSQKKRKDSKLESEKRLHKQEESEEVERKTAGEITLRNETKKKKKID
jgi:hypothetical protein